MPDLNAHYSAVSINELILFTTPEFTRIKKQFKVRVKYFFLLSRVWNGRQLFTKTIQRWNNIFWLICQYLVNYFLLISLLIWNIFCLLWFSIGFFIGRLMDKQYTFWCHVWYRKQFSITNLLIVWFLTRNSSSDFKFSRYSKNNREKYFFGLMHLVCERLPTNEFFQNKIRRPVRR